ncbi:hypothetical protein LINPERHAP2_LOCUS29092 [Linum perenne]
MTESSTSTIGSVCDNELEEIKCPICMEPPHNAILMHCSSAHLGCQPYMCNTSSRHSNCLDQFCSSSKSSPSSITLRSNDSNSCRKNRDGEAYDDELMFDNVVDNQNLKCPLCRGSMLNLNTLLSDLGMSILGEGETGIELYKLERLET